MWNWRWALGLGLIASSCSGKADHVSAPETSGQGGAATSTGGAAGSGGTAGKGVTPGAGGASSVGGASSAGSGPTGGGSSTGGSSAGRGGAPGGNAGADAGVAGSAGATVACTVGGTPDAGAEAAIAGSCIVAIVRVSRVDEECSGAGGTHVTFEIIELGRGGGITTPSTGGHAVYFPAEGPDQVGEFFVAGIDLLDPPVDRTEAGWCLTGLPLTDGNAHTLIAAATEENARTTMQGILN